ncbi:MAG: tetratricopeptide repeat protein, partial [Chloroflexota bacterium]
MALVVGILGFEYMNYTLILPPGQTTLTLEDVPTPGAIFHQAFLENVAKEIPDAPHIFLLIIVTWSLGCLLHLCELARQGVVHFGSGGRSVLFRLRLAAALLAAMAIAGAVINLSFIGAIAGPSAIFGNRLLWVWAALCSWAALRLLGASNTPTAAGRARPWPARLFGAGDSRRLAGVVALIGGLYALPVMVAGAGWVGLLLLVACGVILYLLWDKSWNTVLLPAAIIALVSLGVGLFFAFVQAGQIRTAIIGPQGVTDSPERRVLEANLVTGYLSVFYLFVILLLFFKSVALAWPGLGRIRAYGSTAAYTSLAVLFIASLVAINLTNIRVVQADIVYKRGDPWDKKATRSRQPADWDNAIAVYEHAIDLAPHEDFYYLWLGRAYLEQSSVSDATTQGPLLQRAQDRLIRAQTINPLNTDHTANLARLNTRWAELAKQSGDESSRLAKLEAAVDYYEDALNLSPHNAVIWNEYARLSFALMNDCDKAIELYDKSGEVDPYYPRTYFERADVLTSCAAELPTEEQTAYYEQAVTSYEQGLEREPDDPRVWVQLAQLYQRMDNFEEAAETLIEA